MTPGSTGTRLLSFGVRSAPLPVPVYLSKTRVRGLAYSSKYSDSGNGKSVPASIELARLRRLQKTEFFRPRKTQQTKKEINLQIERKKDWKIAPVKKNIKDTVNAHNKAIDFLSYQWKFKHAIRTFEEMKLKGLQPQVNTYNRVLRVYSKWRKPEEALQVFKEMISQGEKPQLKTYNEILVACARFPDKETWPLALSLLKDMEPYSAKSNPTPDWYAKLIHECSHFRPHHQQANDIFSEMKARGLTPNTNCYNSMILAVAKGGKLEQAFELVEKMKKENISMDNFTYLHLLRGCDVVGDSVKALEIFNEMTEKEIEHSERSYYFTMSALGKAGQVEDCTRLFGEMKSKHITPTVHIFNALITAYFEAGQLKEALDTFDKMPNIRQRSTYSIIISGCEKLGAEDSIIQGFVQDMNNDYNIGIPKSTGVQEDATA